MLDKDIILLSVFITIATATVYACYIILLYTGATIGFILTLYLVHFSVKATTKILDYINNHNINTNVNNNSNKSIP